MLTPTFVIICAQPGAGKSGLSLSLRERFMKASGKALHADVDELRRFHPDLNQIVSEDPMHMGTHTHEDSGIWKGFLLRDASDAHSNVIMEITLKSADNTKREIERFQQEGYAVELHAMAVHENISRLGVISRFEDAIKRVGEIPRYVPIEYHDDAYNALPRNVDDIERSCALNLVTVNTRAGHVSYSRTGQEGKPLAMQSIITERSKSWTAEEREKNLQRWDQVIAMVETRPSGLLKPSFYLADVQKAYLLAKATPAIVIQAPTVEQDLEKSAPPVIAKGHNL